MGKKILTIDGGGIKGIVPAIICADIEDKTGKKINEIFDLISGGSTGSIIGAGLALGIPASEIADMYIEYGDEIFTKRVKWFRPWEYLTKPKYEKKYVRKHLERILGKDTKITDIEATKFMSTARDVVNRKYEFFTSWQDRYEMDTLVDVVIYSLSAVYYFGRTEDKRRNTFYTDGAIGIYNSTPVTSSVEASKLGWLDEGNVSILSLGCGYNNSPFDYDEVGGWTNIDEIMEIFANKEINSINGLKAAIMKHLLFDKIDYRRINPELPGGLTSLDNVDNIDGLIKIAYDATKNIENLDILR